MVEEQDPSLRLIKGMPELPESGDPKESLDAAKARIMKRMQEARESKAKPAADGGAVAETAELVTDEDPTIVAAVELSAETEVVITWTQPGYEEHLQADEVARRTKQIKTV